jgi:hypothetical protein
VVGLSGILGSTNSPYQNLVQVPGTGSRLPIEEAKHEFSQQPHHFRTEAILQAPC